LKICIYKSPIPTPTPTLFRVEQKEQKIEKKDEKKVEE